MNAPYTGPQFIALEGVDGCGKSTQVEYLEAALGKRGVRVTVVREPGGTRVGESIRDILLARTEIPLIAETEALLFLASRVELYETVIRPAVATGGVVVSDRYHLSTLVYQGAAGELGIRRTRELLETVLGDRRPELSLVLELPLHDAVARRSGVGDDRFEARRGFLPRVHRAFEELVRGELVALEGDRVQAIDGTGTPEEVAERIRRVVFP